MNARIDLTHSTPRAWFRSGCAWTKGFAFHGETLFTGASFARHVESLETNLEAELKEFRGEFAIVVERDSGTVLAAVDPIRSMPLFYAAVGDVRAVSDDALCVAAHVGIEPNDDVNTLAFLLQGTTLGSNTLIRHVHQVRAGEVVTLDGRAITRSSYLEVGTRRQELVGIEESKLIDIGVSILETAFDRFLDSYDGPLVVPLSGGLDSRLVAAMIQRAGRRETICYSYGSPGSFDARTSRQVAQQLGLRWEFVTYGRKQWDQWATSNAFSNYRRFASQFCCIEHEQDWPAVLTLAEDRVIPEGAVFVPGHSGDFLAGSHLPAAAFTHEGNPAHWIAHKYLNLWPTGSVGDGDMRQLHAAVGANLRNSSLPHEQFDDYGWRHRQAMMIANSVRGYECHGFDWRLPLWDSDMIAFWSSLPLQYRRDKYLYRKILRHLLGSLMDIPFIEQRPRLSQRLGSLLSDNGFYRHAIFGGPSLAGHLRPMGRVLRPTHPLCKKVVANWKHLPLLRARVNGLLTLDQVEDSFVRIAKAQTE